MSDGTRRGRVPWRRLLIGRWTWWRPFVSLGSIYLGLLGFALLFADRLIFQPPPASYQAADGIDFVETGRGERIAILHLPAREGMPTLLYSHGNAEDLGHGRGIYERWADDGFGVLAYDYPGYGLSDGRPSEAGCERAILAAWSHLRESGVEPSSIVIVGRSVGSGPSVWLAAREPAAGLVLIAPFTSTYAVRVPWPILPGDRFPNLSRIREIETPLRVIHGKRDRVIPASHGRRLVEASAAERKDFVSIEDSGHNDLMATMRNFRRVSDAVTDFALEVAGPPAQ